MLTTEALGATLSRTAMEAHLSLHGWVPVSYGAAGARRGAEIVYVYRGEDRRIRDATVKPGERHDRWDVDSWFFSDPLFAALVKAIIEYDK